MEQAEGPPSPPPTPKYEFPNLSQYEYTNDRELLLLQYNPKYIKSTQSAATMIFLRQQNPSFLQNSLISKNTLYLPTCSIEFSTKPTTQIALLPNLSLIENIGQIYTDPKDKSFMEIVEGMPGYIKNKKQQPRQGGNEEVAEAYAKLRQKDMKARKGVRRRIRALIKRRKKQQQEEEEGE